MARSRGRSTRTQKQVADALGVSQPAISQDPSLPKNPDGSIDPNGALSAASTFEQIQKAQLEKEQQLARRHRMANDEREGTLIPATLAADEQARGDKLVAEALLAVPDRLAKKLVGKPVHEIRNLLMTEIRKALQSASERIAA